MNIAVITVSALIIISKWLDCRTTSTQITHYTQERNPIARNLFKKFGSQKVIWMIFGLTIFIVGISLWILYAFYDAVFYKILYIIIGLIVSVAQFAVAHSNKTKRLNFFTKILMRRYSRYD